MQFVDIGDDTFLSGVESFIESCGYRTRRFVEDQKEVLTIYNGSLENRAEILNHGYPDGGPKASEKERCYEVMVACAYREF